MIELPAKQETCRGTNQENKGLISVDRRAKPTLILTIPCSIFKSSAKDLSLPIFEIVIQDTQSNTFCVLQCWL